jgi:hypothetical protein
VIGVIAWIKGTELEITLMESIIVYGKTTDFYAKIGDLHSHLRKRVRQTESRLGSV